MKYGIWGTILDVLKNSSQNGIGLIVVATLFYLFIFFLIQYFHHGKRFYLLYSFYAFVNGISLAKYIKNVFFSGYFESPMGKFLSAKTHYPSQLFGTLLFTYFIIDIMKLRKQFPKSIHVIDYYYLVVSIIYTGLWSFSIINPKSYLMDYFHGFVYVPLGYVIFFWILFMVYRQKDIIKGYIFSGMLVLGISYLLLFLTTIKKLHVDNQFLFVFYLGILVESLLFALAIGLEQKIVYTENRIITESINRTLSDELAQTRSSILNITAEAQKERTEKLALKFENKFSQLRLDALRSQMNPHFIFNALNSIKSYFIKNDREKAILYLTKFSKLIRNILESSRKEHIFLAEELDALKMYVEIESDRFKNNIEFSIDIEETIDIGNVKVPALFLQPFVENAIWHGLLAKKGGGELGIKVKNSKKYDVLEIEIKDNGIGRKASKKRNTQNTFKKQSLGLDMTKDRFDLFSKKFGKPHSYLIEDLYDKSTQKPKGTLILIEIPKIT